LDSSSLLYANRIKVEAIEAVMEEAEVKADEKEVEELLDWLFRDV